MNNPWFRMYSETAFDPKVQVLTEALQRRYVMALCLHCDGKLVNAPDDEIALALRITVEDWIETKNILIKRELFLDNLEPKGWKKRQYISDIKDPTAAERQKKYRERKRNATITSRPPEADTDTDTDTEKKEKPTPYSEIQKIWNEVLKDSPLAKVKELNESRKTSVKCRWFGELNQSLEAWKALCESVAHSDFLNGNNKESWTATFDWVIKPANMIKILEGNYQNKTIKPKEDLSWANK